MPFVLYGIGIGQGCVRYGLAGAVRKYGVPDFVDGTEPALARTADGDGQRAPIGRWFSIDAMIANKGADGVALPRT